MAETSMKPITPDTRLRDLLDSHPEVEPVLMDLSPSFRKLQNPLLRRTVARIATLRQVATVGKVDLGTLLRTLQRAAGVRVENYAAEDTADGTDGERPAWTHSDVVSKRFDAREIIEAGGHPLLQVNQDLRDVPAGETYELTTGFVPAPLIERVRSQGYRAWFTEEGDSLVRTYISRAQQAEGQDT